MSVPEYYQYDMPQYAPQQYVEYPVEVVEAEEGSTMTSAGVRTFGHVVVLSRTSLSVTVFWKGFHFSESTEWRVDEIREFGECITDSGPCCSAWRRAPALRCWRPTR